MEKAEIQAILLTELGAVLRRELTAADAGETLRVLGVDSLSMVELFVIVERVFGIRLLEAGLGKADLSSLSALAEAIARIKNTSAPQSSHGKPIEAKD
ncbi:MAG: acyl carrier protein [Lentisphaeria bacterium]|nr:acyl carrier protein [Lentisphaeria bacterium]